MSDEQEYQTFEVDVDLDDVIRAPDIDAFNDLVEAHLADSGAIRDTDMLTDIGYDVVGKGAREGTIRLRVTTILESINDEAET